ncbi:hypothetical protein BDV12DRAFT_171121 [Aspergillus spectabilis]
MVFYLFLNQSCQFVCGLRPQYPSPAISANPTRDSAVRRPSDPTLPSHRKSSSGIPSRLQMKSAMPRKHTISRDSTAEVRTSMNEGPSRQLAILVAELPTSGDSNNSLHDTPGLASRPSVPG